MIIRYSTSYSREEYRGLITLGRYHSRLDQSSCAKSIPQYTDLIRTFPSFGHTPGNLVLWYVSLDTVSATQLLYSILNQLLFVVGSSKGRGTRAAGWFADYMEDQGDEQMKSVALAGGVKGWAIAASGEYVEHMAEYDPSAWQ